MGGPNWTVYPGKKTINLGLARLGLNLPGNGEAVAFCGVHFFGIIAGGGIVRHH